MLRVLQWLSRDSLLSPPTCSLLVRTAMGSNSVQQLESQLTAWNPHGALPRAELPNTLGDRSDREILEWLGQLRDKETELIRLHQLLSAVMPEVCTVCADYEAAPQQPSSSGSQSVPVRGICVSCGRRPCARGSLCGRHHCRCHFCHKNWKYGLPKGEGKGAH